MVTVEPVQLYGHKLYLLSSPELDEEDGKAVGHYNYLDENSGEQWCLNAKDGGSAAARSLEAATIQQSPPCIY